jgi:hypothetical protein
MRWWSWRATWSEVSVTDFAARYDAAFVRYRVRRDEGDLQAAYELGREAVARELGVLDLAAIHHDSLLGALRSSADRSEVEEVTAAAADFFMESLSAFEIVRRGFREAREVALVERKQASLLRQLSNFLADTSLAVMPGESVEEALQLVAEHAREVVGAGCCVVAANNEEAAAVSCADDEWAGPPLADLSRIYDAVRPPHGALRLTSEALRNDAVCRALPQTGWLAVPLRQLDGAESGVLHLFDKVGREFSELDEAVAVQLAHMTAAALERARLYRTGEVVFTPPSSRG